MKHYMWGLAGSLGAHDARDFPSLHTAHTVGTEMVHKPIPPHIAELRQRLHKIQSLPVPRPNIWTDFYHALLVRLPGSLDIPWSIRSDIPFLLESWSAWIWSVRNTRRKLLPDCTPTFHCCWFWKISTLHRRSHTLCHIFLMNIENHLPCCPIGGDLAGTGNWTRLPCFRYTFHQHILEI